MKNLRDKINQIINSENIQGISFVRMNEWQWVLSRIASVFLVRGENDLERACLWGSFKEPYTSFQPKDPITELKSLLNTTDRYFFIASEENGKYWVMEGDGTSIASLISNSFYFEYYIADKSISWLLCENHHGVMVQLKSNVGTFKNV